MDKDLLNPKAKTQSSLAKPQSSLAKNSFKKGNRLGRGLEALLGPVSEKAPSLLEIETVYPNPKQPRSHFNKKNLEELSQSIKTYGLLQAILVEKTEKGYKIIAGERRWRAASLAGLRKIPAIVKEAKPQEKDLLALTENLQRENLSAIESARAFKKIMETQKLSQELLAQKLSIPRSSLANILRLLQLDKTVQQLIEDKQISFSQAKELLRFKSPKVQKLMAQKLLKQGLTVKKISSKAQPEIPFWAKKTMPELKKKLWQNIKLTYLKGKGRISLSFKTEEELKKLLDRLWDKS